MFTGIIEETGYVNSLKKSQFSSVIAINCTKVLEDVHLGDSIAVNGVCLTVTSFNSQGFTADVMNETLSRSTLGTLSKDSMVNLERAMAANGRFGGHIVSGHIDGLGKIEKISKDGNAVWFQIKTDPKIMKYVIEKGSVTIDGISLTVAKVDRQSFYISTIPATIEKTNLSQKKVGSLVNLENDIVGKYVENFLIYKNKGNITREFLIENGF